jgi:hypothetical protein
MIDYMPICLVIFHEDPEMIDRFSNAFLAGRLCEEFAPCPFRRPHEDMTDAEADALKWRVGWCLENWGTPIEVAPNPFNVLEIENENRLALRAIIVGGNPGKFESFWDEFGFASHIVSDDWPTVAARQTHAEIMRGYGPYR